MKKTISILIFLILALALVSCGDKAKTTSVPEHAVIRSDIEAYIKEMIDEKAKISICEITEEIKDDTNYNVTAIVLYEDSDGDNRNEFSLTYSLEDNKWILVKCRMNNLIQEPDDNDASSETTPNPPETAPNPPDTTPEDTTPEDTTPPPTNPVDEISMSDNLYDFTFSLDGKVYKLPFAFSLLTDDGWTISSSGYSSSSTIAANSYDSLAMSKNGNRIYVHVINLSGNQKEIKDCKVGGIDITSYNLNDPSDFYIAKGITLNSTLDEITSAFGMGNDTNTYDDYTRIKYTKDSYVDVNICIYNESTKYNEITLRNYIKDESDETQTITDVPAYLSEYVAPTELSSNIKSGIIELDGDLYQLPAPLSVFISNGWNLVSKPDSVGSHNTTDVRLERNGKKIYVYIANYAEYQTTPENCAVYRVSVSKDEKVPMAITKKISIGSKKDDVVPLIPDDFSYYKGTYSYQYSFSDYSIDLSVSINIGITSETVETLSVSNENWNY